MWIRLTLLNFVQFREADEGCQHLVLEADPRPANAVATVENQLLQVLNAVPVTPEHFDCFGNAFMVRADNRHLMVNAGLAGQFVQRHGPRGLKLCAVVEVRKADEFFF